MAITMAGKINCTKSPWQPKMGLKLKLNTWLIAWVTFLLFSGAISDTKVFINESDSSKFTYKLLPLTQKLTESPFVSNASGFGGCPATPKIVILNKFSSKTVDKSGSQDAQKLLFYTLAEDQDGKIVHIENSGMISLLCVAREPVQWGYSGIMTQDVIKTISITREAPDPQNEATFCFKTSITVPFPRPPNYSTFGLYTCAGPQAPILNSNLKTPATLFLFGNDNLPNLLVSPKGKIRSFESLSYSTDKPFTIPCKGNNPNVTVKLTKQNKKGDYEPLNNATYTQVYDPRTGFSIFELEKPANNFTANISNVDLYGKYKCKTIGNLARDDYLDVLVQNGGEKPRRSQDLKIVLQDYGKCKRFVCLSNLDNPENGGNFSSNSLNSNSNSNSTANQLVMSIINCDSPIQCELALNYLNEGLDSLVAAKMDTCGHLEDFSSLQAINKKSMAIDLDNFGGSGGVAVCRTADKKYFQTVQFFRSINQSETAVILKSEEQPTLNLKMAPSSLINIVGPNRTIFVKQEVQISCDLSSFIFAKGAKLFVKFSNGTLAPLNVTENLASQKVKALVELTALVNITTTDILGFVCLAPMWNSNEWVNATLAANVSEGQLPQFIETSEANVRYYDTDFNRTLICEADGAPPPVITWYNNEEPFQDNTRNAWEEIQYFENKTRSVLHFTKVTHHAMTVQGIYTCNATNVKGTIEFPVTVLVTEFSTSMYWVPIVSVVFLLLVVFLAFFLLKFWKKSQTQERYIHQLTKYEIQQFKYGRRSVKLPARDEDATDISSGLPNYANISGGIEEALDLPYDEDKFEINEQDLNIEECPVTLGEGNFGIVVEGTLFHNQSRIPVAIKTLKQWNVNEAKILLSELKILMYVGKHENVVSLLGAVTNIAQYKIQVVIEYCAEGSLEKFLRQKRDVFLDEANKDGDIQYTQVLFNENTPTTNYVKADGALRTFDLIRWAHQFARGMEYLASRKIVHGDLAARNLLLTDTKELKITDFGLSKKLKNYQKNYVPNENSSEREQPWRSLAVECWLDNKQLSTESDVWSFGITLWEIFSLARVPYPDFPIYTPDFIRHLLAGYRMASPPYATPKIFEIMTQCWDSDPESRPSFTSLVLEFEKLLPGNYVKFLHLQYVQQEHKKLNENPTQNTSNSSYITDIDQVVNEQLGMKPPPLTMAAHNIGYILADQMEQFEIEN